MKKFISICLTLCMLLTMVGTINVSAAAGDGVLDSDIGSTPEFTVSNKGKGDERHNYEEDGYKFSGRVSHAAHSWEFKNNELGNGGYSFVGKTVSGVSGTTAQNDPCLMAFVDFTNPAMLTSTDQYYKIEFDFAVTNDESFEIRATTDNGSTIQLLDGGIGLDKTIDVDALCQNGIYKSYKDTWTKYQIIIKSDDVTSTDDGANDSTAENTHQYWIYANGYLIKSGTTSLKKYNENNYLNSFAGIKALQLRAYHNAFKTDSETGFRTPTKDVTVRIDNFSTSVINSLPATDWEASMNFDSLTESTDVAAINTEIWNEQLGYFIHGSTYAGNVNYTTKIRNDKNGLASVEGGVYGKDASDKAISISLDGTQTDATHFFAVSSVGHGQNTMQPMKKGDFYELQTYMAWESDAKTVGIQGMYSNTSSEDGKGKMLLSIGTDGLINVLGTKASGTVKLSPQTWYKFNIVVHSGDVNATNAEDKNWYNLYVNDTLIAEKVEFTPSRRGGNQDTFLGVDSYWFQVSTANPNKSGKLYIDDIKIKYSETEPTYSPVTVSTTDEIAAGYIGAQGHVPGFGSYLDERVSFDAEKWSVSDGGTITLIPATDGINNYAKIVKADGTKIFDNFKKQTTTVNSVTLNESSVPENVFDYGPKDFSSYAISTGIAGRGADDYSFKLDSVGVYDNWVMTVDEDGNETTAAYQKDPANWVNKSDIPSDTTATYKFRDSYNPFVQLWKNDIGALDYNAPWSLNISILAGGEFNSKDIQAISDDTGSRVTMNLVSIKGANNEIYVDKTSTGVIAAKDQWINFVINIYPATKGYALWCDGELIYEGTFNFPWERFARIKIQDAIGHDGYHSAKARTSRVYVDDIIFYQGARFVPTAIEAAATGDKFDSTYLADNVIIADENTTVSDITGGITGGTVALYANKTYAAATDVTKGNIAVVKSSNGLVYKYIYVADSSEAASAEIAFKQEYKIGDNTFGPKYYTDNAVDGKIIVASYKTVDGRQQLADCNFVSTDGAAYEYNGNKVVMTPAERVKITVPSDTTGVKIFLWDNLTNLKPIAEESNCNLKVEE